MVLYMCYVYYKLIEHQNVWMWLERKHSLHRYALVFWKEDSKHLLWPLLLSPCPFQYILPEATDIQDASSVRNFKPERHSKFLPSAPSFCKLITNFGPQDVRPSTVEEEVTSQIIHTLLVNPLYREVQRTFGGCANEKDKFQSLVYCTTAYYWYRLYSVEWESVSKLWFVFRFINDTESAAEITERHKLPDYHKYVQRNGKYRMRPVGVVFLFVCRIWFERKKNLTLDKTYCSYSFELKPILSQ